MNAFGAGPSFALGVEEEFQLVDPDSGQLVSRMDQIIGIDDPIREDGVQSEIFQSMVEIATPVCRDVDEAREALAHLRGAIIERASDDGLAIAAAGTHPSALHEDQEVTEKPRYQRLIEEVRWPVKQDLTFGLHVHVAVPSGDAAVAAMNGLRPVVPVLLALSANSPFWRGMATGLRSTRVEVFGVMPRSGLPRAFLGWEDLAGSLDELTSAGVIRDVTKLWWDVRPRPDLGTVEVRICDACTSLEESLALAGFIQAAVAHLSTQEPRQTGEPGGLSTELIKENRWRATRDGVHTELLHAEHDGTPGSEPVHDALNRILEGIQPALDEFGLKAQAAVLHETARRARTGADRQLEVYERTGDLRAVVQDVVERTRQGSRA